MLLTVTMNPSVDISYGLETLHLDTVNRTGVVSKTAGGKGLNVSRVAKQAGLEVVATGIIGGFLGDFIKEQLETIQIGHDFFEIDQESRNCIAILHQGQQTEILENGPTISTDETKAFLAHFSALLEKKEAKIMTISGSLPAGMGPEVYREMIRQANEANIPVILDASGANLLEVLEDESIHVQAIKPNMDEILAIEEEDLAADVDSLMKALEGARYNRAKWVVVSLGADGALIKSEQDFYRAYVPTIEAVSPVGSGDSTVAGLALGYLKNQGIEETIKVAMTTGVLNTLNEKTGHIDMDLFDEIYKQIRVEKL